MPRWPAMILLWLLALEGLMLILAPRFVKAVMDEATPSVLRAVGAVELLFVVLVLVHVAA